MYSSSRCASLVSTILLSCLLATGCREAVKSLGELSKLQSDIIKEYKEDDVRVNLTNNTSLTVTFVNSALNSQESEQRQQRAARTASFVITHYPSVGKLQEIWVVLMLVKTRFVVVNYSETVGYFGFDKTGQPLRERDLDADVLPVEAVDETRPTAAYNATLKRTEVIVRQMPLEGDLNNGFSVVPHFSVPGDASGVRRSTSFPESVSFDFLSFSEKSIFPGAPKFTFLTDGKVVFEASEQFSTSKVDEKFSEFATINIPYPTFRRMVSGRSLNLKIGERDYAFSSKQLAALREMTNYVKD
jgi:hypothetical protein